MPPLPDLTYDSNLSQPMAKGFSNSGSSTSASSHSQHSQSPETSSATQSSNQNSKATTPIVDAPGRIEKRKANTMAARRYRQKRVDQMSSLETQIKETQTERDDLKVRCARLEGEVETLRALLAARN